MSNSIYYNLGNILGYDKLFNIIVGARSIGKTYGLKKRGFNRFIKLRMWNKHYRQYRRSNKLSKRNKSKIWK